MYMTRLPIHRALLRVYSEDVFAKRFVMVCGMVHIVICVMWCGRGLCVNMCTGSEIMPSAENVLMKQDGGE